MTRKRLEKIEQRLTDLEEKLAQLAAVNSNLKAQLAEARAPREKVVSVRDESGGPWKQSS